MDLPAFVDLVLRQYASGMLMHVVPWASGSSMTRHLPFRYHEWSVAQGGLSLPIYYMTPLLRTSLVWFDDDPPTSNNLSSRDSE